jgi:hypothetical protein
LTVVAGVRVDSQIGEHAISKGVRDIASVELKAELWREGTKSSAGLTNGSQSLRALTKARHIHDITRISIRSISVSCEVDVKERWSEMV